MKTTSKCLLGSWRSAALGAALLLTGGLSNVCHAQPSPVGTWDCVLSGGGQPGVAYLTFTTNLDASGNYTFYGYAVVAGVPPGSEISERTPNGDPGRGGSTTTTNSIGTTNIFGFVPMSGPWGYDSLGRVIGNFSELINATSVVTNESGLRVKAQLTYVITNSSGAVDGGNSINLSTTFTNVGTKSLSWALVSSLGETNLYSVPVSVGLSNYSATLLYVVTNSNGNVDKVATTNVTATITSIPQTNVFGWTAVSTDSTTNSFTNTFVLDTFESTSTGSGEMTNQVSFVGKVVPGKRLTLNSSTTFGQAVYRGVPAVALPNLTGTRWNGLKRQQGVKYVEFFSLQSFGGGNPFADLSDDITNFPNIYYSTNGVGPGYEFGSIVIVSKQQKAGFATTEFAGSNTVLRATYGGFHNNSKTITSNSKGVIEPDQNITYKAQKQ